LKKEEDETMRNQRRVFNTQEGPRERGTKLT